jgi:hypothetical protein
MGKAARSRICGCCQTALLERKWERAWNFAAATFQEVILDEHYISPMDSEPISVKNLNFKLRALGRYFVRSSSCGCLDGGDEILQVIEVAGRH